jgi:hypothetical protein
MIKITPERTSKYWLLITSIELIVSHDKTSKTQKKGPKRKDHRVLFKLKSKSKTKVHSLILLCFNIVGSCFPTRGHHWANLSRWKEGLLLLCQLRQEASEVGKKIFFLIGAMIMTGWHENETWQLCGLHRA